jgi:glycine/D-amino acid oxidase-like deaminating enzyme
MGGSVAPKPSESPIAASYADVPPRSPWISQLAPDGPAHPLDADAAADVAIVGAGIAGVATAFHVLRSTDTSVLLIERDRVARGATGRNAGQLTTYFERPLGSIAAEFGEGLAVDAQRTFDGAHDLMDAVAAECGATVRVERFDGHMAMFNLNHVLVHLGNNEVRRTGGIRTDVMRISEDAEFLASIPAAYDGLYEVVPQAHVRELLETTDDRYRAVLSERKGCANGGLFVQQVLADLLRRYPDRLRYVDTTPVQRIVVGEEDVRLQANGVVVSAAHAVLCTNGFTGHLVEDADGRLVELHPDQRVVGTIGYMAAFVETELRAPAAFSYIRNVAIGGDVPYVYVTRRTWDLPSGTATLTCMGGPEWPVPDASWDAAQPFPGELLTTMDDQVRPYAQPRRPPRRPYDFQWHGLMGYMAGRVRVIGAHPEHPRLLYNLGCNGVGFLPSIAGGDRIGRMLAGQRLAPSIFDPRLADA